MFSGFSNLFLFNTVMHKAAPPDYKYEKVPIVDHMAQYLHIRLNVMNYGLTKLTLTNAGNIALPTKNWQMYFYYSFFIKSVNNVPLGKNIDKHGIRITHINGDLYCMEPTAAFKYLLPDRRIELYLQSSRIIARTDVMPNWYVVSCGVPRILNCTKDEAITFVGPFDSPNKWTIHPDNRSNSYTPEQRYSLNKVEDLRKVVRPVMPTPVELTISDASTLTIDPQSWVIISKQGMEQEAAYLSGKSKCH